MYKDKIEEIVKRWHKRGIVSYEVYSYAFVYDFIVNIDYFSLAKSEKENIAMAFRLNKIKPDMTITEINKIALENRHIRGKKGRATLLSRYNQEEIDRIYKNRDLNNGRIRAFRKKFPEESKDMSDDECLRESYVRGIKHKGMNAAIDLGLDIGVMTDEELSKLSGYYNHSKLSASEKEKVKIAWKKSNLLNPRVQSMIGSEYPDFLKLNVDDLVDIQIEKWYSVYVSMRIGKSLPTRHKSRPMYDSGYYFSHKSDSKHYYRSSYEKKAYTYLDGIDSIIKFESEPYHMICKDRTGKHMFTYVPDILVWFESGKKLLIEIKPTFKIEEFMANRGNTIMSQSSLPFCVISEKELKSKEKFYECIKQYSNQ